MTKEETKEAIKVMQAYVDGVEIEVKAFNEWEDISKPAWDWGSYDYRIKQKELVPGRKYRSILWEYYHRFIGMDGEKYVFKIVPLVGYESYLTLPEDIQEVEAQ